MDRDYNYIAEINFFSIFRLVLFLWHTNRLICFFDEMHENSIWNIGYIIVLYSKNFFVGPEYRLDLQYIMWRPYICRFVQKQPQYIFHKILQTIHRYLYWLFRNYRVIQNRLIKICQLVVCEKNTTTLSQ